MSPAHVVVDGSNIATEGRSMPSLRQLDDAVRQFQDEFADAEPIVVVDATFGHRIDPSERKAFEEAVAHGEIVSPPAGAIGRGDAFVLGIAERVHGQVLSNDSFQEFHADHPWLFDEGRLIGGKPVPGVGWIFTPRRPVRPARSSSTRGRGADAGEEGTGRGTPASRPARRRRSGVLEALEAAAAQATEAATASGDGGPPAPPVPAPSRAPRRRPRRRRRGGDPEVQAAIEAATEEAIGPRADATPERRPARAAAGLIHGPQAVNDPLTFLQFISEHPLGDEVAGTVANFVSHGAMVDVGDMHCYVPLSGLGLPPPKSARAALRKGESRPFVVVALDPARRGAQLALPEVVTPTAGATAPARKAKKPGPVHDAPRAPRPAAAKPRSHRAPAEKAPAGAGPSKRAKKTSGQLTAKGAKGKGTAR